MSDRLYFRQLLAGRDFAGHDPIAAQMVNFVYAVGDRETGEALLIDPAYDVAELVQLVEADGMKLAGALATHYHPDHVGGDLFGHPLQGIRELLELRQVPIHAQRTELPWIERATGVGRAELVGHDSSDQVLVGAIPIELIHTPGHTPGSQCFLVDRKLIAGDTLFLEGCGRTDLPGGDPREMWLSLSQRLAKVPDDVRLYPGHQYSPDNSALMGETRRTNPVFRR
jgi:glyoxylase-like metal-dependent hydrolase (beta-lactamase superfamily II)